MISPNVLPLYRALFVARGDTLGGTMTEKPSSAGNLSTRLQQISAQLNTLRVAQEPQPSSRLPVLGPLWNLLRRWANRLATRW